MRPYVKVLQGAVVQHAAIQPGTPEWTPSLYYKCTGFFPTITTASKTFYCSIIKRNFHSVVIGNNVQICLTILQVKGQELGWSLGFMINASNLIPTEASCSKFSVSGFYIGIPVVAVCFLVGVILLVAAVYRYTWRKRKIPYEELGTPNDSNKYGSVWWLYGSSIIK